MRFGQNFAFLLHALVVLCEVTRAHAAELALNELTAPVCGTNTTRDARGTTLSTALLIVLISAFWSKFCSFFACTGGLCEVTRAYIAELALNELVAPVCDADTTLDARGTTLSDALSTVLISMFWSKFCFSFECAGGGV